MKLRNYFLLSIVVGAAVACSSNDVVVGYRCVWGWPYKSSWN